MLCYISEKMFAILHMFMILIVKVMNELVHVLILNTLEKYNNCVKNKLVKI